MAASWVSVSTVLTDGAGSRVSGGGDDGASIGGEAPSEALSASFNFGDESQRPESQGQAALRSQASGGEQATEEATEVPASGDGQASGMGNVGTGIHQDMQYEQPVLIGGQSATASNDAEVAAAQGEAGPLVADGTDEDLAMVAWPASEAGSSVG